MGIRSAVALALAPLPVAMAALGALLLLVLIGCGPDQGTVVEKDFRPGYTTVMIMPCGKGCMIPVPNRIPDCWELVLDTGERCVSHNEWEATEIGDFWEES